VKIYRFKTPSGKSADFHGEYLAGVKDILGFLDIAVYRTGERFMVVWAKDREPSDFYETESIRDLLSYLLAALGTACNRSPVRSMVDGELREFAGAYDA